MSNSIVFNMSNNVSNILEGRFARNHRDSERRHTPMLCSWTKAVPESEKSRKNVQHRQRRDNSPRYHWENGVGRSFPTAFNMSNTPNDRYRHDDSTVRAIIWVTEDRNAPAMLATSRGATQEVSAPMCSKCIPTTTEETTEYVHIPLHDAEDRGLYAVVDAADVDLVSPFRWHPLFKRNGIYAYAKTTTNGKRRTILMHRLILGIEKTGVYGDHINHDTLDNRRVNLRPVSPRDNAVHRRSNERSTSEYKGVSWERSLRRWRAEIKVGSNRIFLGRFDCEQDAARAYDNEARRHYGPSALCNFPEEGGAA